MESIIKEMKQEDKRATEQETQYQSFFRDRRIIRIMATTRSGKSADLCLTQRSDLDKVITEYKGQGRIVTLPRENKLEMDCFGLCSIRCGRFKDNCRKCIKDFYEVK